MPEGPEVYTVTNKLNRALSGQKLVEITFLSNKYNGSQQVYQTYIKPYLPANIDRVFCKGKYIYFQLTLVNSQIIYLHSHLKMTGKWVWKKDSYVKIIFNFGIKTPISNIVMNTLYFSDMRGFGEFDIYLNTEQLIINLNKLGPDVLTEILSYDAWWLALDKTKKGKINICSAIMDQSRISGLGNYLKAEILYRARIHPDRLLCEIDEERKQLLYYAFYQIPNESARAGGLTISDYYDPDGKAGTYNKLIYGQTTDPNGYPVLTKKTPDGRTTHYVEQMQI